MARFDDIRKTFEAAAGSVTPAKAQELAKSFLEPGAAKEQVAKTAADILDWSHRNSERVRGLVRREIQEQLHQAGAATQQELDALRKRVRDLERAAGMTASGRANAAKRSAKAKPAARKPAARKPAAKRKPATTTTTTAPPAST
jgi:polyhydroxyalkanoate synthesis regulator phasin